MKRRYWFLAIVLMVGFFSSLTYSTELSFNGHMFGEYYYVLSHNSGAIKNGGVEGRNGFWFRRIYFTTDAKFSDSIKARLRFEMGSPGSFPFDSSDTLTPFVKDAYISYKYSGHEFLFGIISTPTWGHNIEDIWGYRSVEKTPLDLMKMGSSRDFGIGAKGALNEGKTVTYMFMLGNGASNKGETNKQKKIYGALAFKPTKGLTLEGYADFEREPGDKSYYVLQGFGAYQADWGRVGAMFARRHLSENATDYDYDVLSAFAVYKAAKNLEFIARFDRMFGNGFESKFKGQGVSYIPFANNPGAPFNLIITGISWNAAKDVWLIPNLKFVVYGDPDIGEKPGNDVYANMTVYFKF